MFKMPNGVGTQFMLSTYEHGTNKVGLSKINSLKQLSITYLVLQTNDVLVIRVNTYQHVQYGK